MQLNARPKPRTRCGMSVTFSKKVTYNQIRCTAYIRWPVGWLSHGCRPQPTAVVTMSGCIFPLSTYGLVAFVMFTFHLLNAFRGIKYDGQIGFKLRELAIGYLIYIPQRVELPRGTKGNMRNVRTLSGQPRRSTRKRHFGEDYANYETRTSVHQQRLPSSAHMKMRGKLQPRCLVSANWANEIGCCSVDDDDS